MTEDKFYDICDQIENFPSQFTEGYYPTIDELEELHIEKRLEEFLPFLIYFGNDPYKDTINDIEYKATVKYIKDLLLKIKFDPPEDD